MAEQVGCGLLVCYEVCVCGRLWVNAPAGASITKSFSSCQETGKVFSSEVSFYSKFINPCWEV